MSQSIIVLSRSIIQELVEVQSILIGVLGDSFDRWVEGGVFEEDVTVSLH